MKAGYFSGTSKARLINAPWPEETLRGALGVSSVRRTRQSIGGIEFDVISCDEREDSRVVAASGTDRLYGFLLLTHDGRDVTHEETILVNRKIHLCAQNRDGISGLVIRLD